MLALKQLNIPAVAYLGKTFSENETYINFAKLNLNVAIIMDGKYIFKNPKDDSEYSNLMKNVHLSSPVNFAQFKNIINSYPSGSGKSDNVTGSPRGFGHDIEIAGISKSYSDTWFCKFEQHLSTLDLKNCCMTDIKKTDPMIIHL